MAGPDLWCALRQGLLALLLQAVGCPAPAPPDHPGPPEAEPIQGAPLGGPFPDLATFCDQSRAQVICLSNQRMVFACPGTLLSEVVAPPAPYRAIQLFRTTCADPERLSGSERVEQVHLALRLRRGWFVADDLVELRNVGTQEEALTLEELTPRDLLPGRGPELLLRFTHRALTRSVGHHQRQLLWVAGIGRRGTPAITPALLLSSWRGTDEPVAGRPARSGGRLRLLVLPGGELEMTGPLETVGDGLDPQVLRRQLGRRRVLLP